MGPKIFFVEGEGDGVTLYSLRLYLIIGEFNCEGHIYGTQLEITFCRLLSHDFRHNLPF